LADKSITTLIVDDEPLARKFVRRMLLEHPSVAVVGECRTGEEAVISIKEKKPDLVFLDVQMPEMDGFSALHALADAALPHIVFVTAYEQYAIQAFESAALDYLLKPFDQLRFDKAMSRVYEKFADRQEDEAHRKKIAGLLEILPQKRTYLDRLLVKTEGRLIFLRTSELDWIQADGKYVHLHAGNKSHLVRQTLGSIEEQLDPQTFVRIHRSAIVNVERIKELHPMFAGEHVVLLDNGKKLTASRSYKEQLFAVLGKPL
jgi:two-component system, LytTR family, response regulator